MSNETKLELQLINYNSKIELYSKIYVKLNKLPIINKIILNKIKTTTELRDEVFRTLRRLIQKKYPEKFGV